MQDELVASPQGRAKPGARPTPALMKASTTDDVDDGNGRRARANSVPRRNSDCYELGCAPAAACIEQSGDCSRKGSRMQGSQLSADGSDTKARTHAKMVTNACLRMRPRLATRLGGGGTSSAASKLSKDIFPALARITAATGDSARNSRVSGEVSSRQESEASSPARSQNSNLADAPDNAEDFVKRSLLQQMYLPGSNFGSSSLLLWVPQRSDVVAVKLCECLLLKHAAFLELQERFPDLPGEEG